MFEDYLFKIGSTLNRKNYKINEINNNYLLLIECPGLKKEDIKVSVEDDRLFIKYETEDETVYDNNSFDMIFDLTDKFKVDEIGAEYIDGILKITIPIKTKKGVDRFIEIKY